MGWFYNLKIFGKLMVLSAGMILGALVVGGLGLRNIQLLSGMTSSIYHDQVQPMLSINEVSQIQQRFRIQVSKLLAETDGDKRDQLSQKYRPQIQEMSQILKSEQNWNFNAEQAEKWATITKLSGEIEKSYTQIFDMVDNFARDQGAQKMAEETGPLAEQIDALLNEIILAKREEIRLVYEHSQSVQHQAFLITIGLLAATVGVSLLFGLWVTRLITSPLSKTQVILSEMSRGRLGQRLQIRTHDEVGQMAQAMDHFADDLEHVVNHLQRLSQGDLTVEVISKDDQDRIGNALQATITNLSQMLGQIQMISTEVANGSNQVSGASQHLAQGTTEQASALEQIGASMTEIATQTQQNADNAVLANRLSTAASQSALTGNEKMQTMSASMSDIEKASANISKIIKVIDEIAFQTNLLALNAAVEAARAGRHGKGFAVVAEEVRNLAERSAQAARETTAMIEDSRKKVLQGLTITQETASALGEIVTSISKVSDLIGEIAAASREQSLSIQQINQGLSQVEQVTHTNTATAEQSASAAEEMSAQARRLQEMLGNFQLRQRASTSETGALALSPELLEQVQYYLTHQKVTPPSLSLT